MRIIETLTKRERECLYHAAQDKGCRETATVLHLSIETVKTHRKVALHKLGCRTIGGAIRVALEKKFISL